MFLEFESPVSSICFPSAIMLSMASIPVPLHFLYFGSSGCSLYLEIYGTRHLIQRTGSWRRKWDY